MDVKAGEAVTDALREAHDALEEAHHTLCGLPALGDRESQLQRIINNLAGARGGLWRLIDDVRKDEGER